MATKLFLLLAICVLPVLVNANNKAFQIVGRVYCDACRAGFETSKCSYIHGARVEIKCFDRPTLKLKYSIGAETDETGTYNIVVEDDHEDQICHATLVSSPIPSCRIVDPRRNKATAILTRSNGAISNLHYTNAMGFLQDTVADGCQELLLKLLQDDE
ncbi:hypothetical protein ES319_D12G106300v1 [Gossypium barbadense]|uniref:Uncharacterized protein n=1 Tax=Gossypium barbadense TaxID=3634 RepID=A0A5J5NWQ4_GOSBA|nr:hypothetical protein ES319_D12G106300v1 [Gossypium barbadense]PPD91551.1 hypothetical protein GOBAR_DD11512 [Gossypium barbadense]